MLLSDFLYITLWWSILFISGISFFPFVSKLFPFMSDKGYPFAKVISILVISYIIFVLAMGIIPFSQLTATLIAFITCISFFYGFHSIHSNRKGVETIKDIFIKTWKIILIEEIIFLTALLFWSYIRTFQPDIYGLEKYMDYGFVNSILRSSTFPPKDMWFTPYAINYYYFGHLITAVITKISTIPSNITYNLMIATLFAFCFTLSYSIITNLYFFILSEQGMKKIILKQKFIIFIVGIITASLVSLGGNLHIIYMFFTPYNTENPVPFTHLTFSLQTIPNEYWYPNATRFIYNTIHEFPLYSFVVSDLHGHVISIPIILTIIFVLFSLYLQEKLHVLQLLLISFLLSTAYMTNAWDGAIYILLTFFVIITIEYRSRWREKSSKKTVFLFLKNTTLDGTFIINILYYAMIVIAGFFLFSLPFSLNFKPFVGGIGILCAPEFLTNLKQLGPLIFESNHCQKSPLWQLLILHGFYYFFIASFIIFLIKTKKILRVDFFIILLIVLGTILIIIPEFIYLKDIYPAHYRANTMFKLVYQSFIMLSLVSGYVLFRLITHIPSIKTQLGKFGILCFLTIVLFSIPLVLYYPITAVKSYYENITTPKSLNGTSYLQTLHPDDYEAIQWINKNIDGQPIIVEAQGDSYTDFARISSNTGLPTILGWTVHEWLWRGTYDIPAPRITEVQTLYETNNVKEAQEILKKYAVTYVYIGDLERQKYPKLMEDKFKQLGKIFYKHGNTRIYQITDL